MKCKIMRLLPFFFIGAVLFFIWGSCLGGGRMNGFDFAKIVGAIFFALIIVLFLVFVTQQAGKLGAPPKTIVHFQGGGTMEIEGAK